MNRAAVVGVLILSAMFAGCRNRLHDFVDSTRAQLDESGEEFVTVYLRETLGVDFDSVAFFGGFIPPSLISEDLGIPYTRSTDWLSENDIRVICLKGDSIVFEEDINCRYLVAPYVSDSRRPIYGPVLRARPDGEKGIRLEVLPADSTSVDKMKNH